MFKPFFTADFKSWKPYLALLTVYLVWGTTLGAIRIGIQDVPPALFACARFFLSSGILLLICLSSGERIPAFNTVKREIILGVILLVLGHSAVYWTLQTVPVGICGILGATNPLWMFWLTSVMPPKETIDPRAYLGIAVGFVGMVILLLPQWLAPQDTLNPMYWTNIFITVASTVFWSLGSIYSRKKPANHSLLMSLALQNITAGIIYAGIAAFTTDFTSITFTDTAVLALMYLVIFGTILATSSYLYVLQELSVPTVSTIAYVTPILTVWFGWAFLNETITLATCIGTAIIFLGVLIVQQTNRSRILKP